MKNARLLKNARLEYSAIKNNNQYVFSLKHALSIYPIDAIYTFIPKNACSSLRYSTAIANGFIGDIGDIDWIHKNNIAFMPTQREIAIANYTFVVLRCPFTRVASCFFNQVVDGEIDFKDTNGSRLSISFNDFLKIIRSQERHQRNQHWRNQSDFLHYERYDEYFSLELFSKAITSLGERGFQFHDTRETLGHNNQSFERTDGSFQKVKEIEIKKMKEDGVLPNYSSMFGDEEIKLVNEIYKDDIELYKSYFGASNLLF